MATAESDEISEEIELLKAIYVHELEVVGPQERPTLVNLFLHPSTGDDDHNSKYVCLNLVLTISEKYPFHCPGISIKNPRGLSDAHCVSIQENLCALAKEKTGSPMLYDLIEYTKECLSDNNVPSCPCVICLEHFEREEKFVKTECYHYFHAVCLANYVDHFLSLNEEDKMIVCPMCRLKMEYNKHDHDIKEGNSFSKEMFVYKPDKEQLRAQAERQKIFEYQKSKGGIIDVEEERNKFLIGIKDKKKDENKSSELHSHQISIPLKSDGSSRENPNLDGDDQPCGVQRDNSGRRKLQIKHDVQKGNHWESKTRSPATGGGNESESCDSVSKNRNDDKRTRERNYDRPRRSRETRRECSEQVRENRSRFKQAEMSRKERGLNSERKEEKISPQPKTDNISKDCDLSASDRQMNEMSAAEQPREENWKPVDPTDEEKTENDEDPVTQLNLSTTSSRTNRPKLSPIPTKSTPCKNVVPRKERGRNMCDNCTSKQVINKEHVERDKAQRKRESQRTSRRSQQENSKPPVERKYPKSYSSVTSGTDRAKTATRKDQTNKRNDAIFSEKNKFGNKSSKSFPGKSERTSPDIADKVLKKDGVVNANEHKMLAPPPGFENIQPVVDGKGFGKGSDLKKKLGTAQEEPRDAPQRPPPGFENVLLSAKK